MSNPIKVRFPPSPTGYCHVGTARMALLNYAFARGRGGSIVFRIEDTDRERSTKEYEDDIIKSFEWLGLEWDEFYRQSERTNVYVDALKRLIAADKAYVSDEESKKDPTQRVQVVRLRNPGSKITFTDIVRGEITFDTTELGDFAIARSMNDPLYHLTVVIDDGEMGITHVIRGEEHISNTPRQILIQEALGYTRPIYAHYPLFLGADKSKLSKRKGDVAIRDYAGQGFLAEAMINYIGALGWTPPSGNEIFSKEDMVKDFQLEALHKSGGVFDIEKLRWYNRQYLLAMPEADVNREATDVLREAISSRVTWNAHIASSITPLIKERVSVWEDVRTQVAEGEYDFFFADPTPETDKIPGKKDTREIALEHLQQAREIFATIPENEFQSADVVKTAIWAYAEEKGRGAVLWPLRYSLSGRERSPDPFIIAATIGQSATLRRIDAACTRLRNL